VSPSTISVLRQASDSTGALVGGPAGAPDSAEGREVVDVALSEPDDEQPASSATAIDTTNGAVCPCRVEVIDRGRRNGAIAVTLSPLNAESQHDRQRPGER
jgi:hypothetical protein